MHIPKALLFSLTRNQDVVQASYNLCLGCSSYRVSNLMYGSKLPHMSATKQTQQHTIFTAALSAG
jgi:hypothetical protein